MAIINQIFSNQTLKEFEESSMKTFQSKTQNKNCVKGTLVLLQNKDKKEIVGLAKLGSFEDNKTLRERFLLDADVYSGENAKFNGKYEICIEKLVMFQPISYSNFAFLFDIDNEIPNNISKGTPFDNRKLFYKAEDKKEEDKVLKKIMIWANSIMGI